MRGLSVSLLLALTLVGGVLASGAAVAQSYSTVEERMSGAEFKAAGLEKLSPEELAALNAWLQKQSDRVLATAPGPNAVTAPTQDRNGFESDNRRVVRSRIAGTFTGWSGSNRFELENGQVWQQVDGSSLDGIKPMENPVVTIEPGFLGSWRLKVEGYNSVAKVKRVK